MITGKYQWAVNILNNGGTVTLHRFTYRSERVRYKLNRLYRDGVLDRALYKAHLEFRLKKDQPKLTNLASKIKHTEKST